MKLQRMEQIARRVRRWAMRNRRNWHSDRHLHGLCAVTAFRVFTQLRAAGFSDVTLCLTEDDDHAFVHCAGYMVDVTATQFNGYGYDAHVYKAVEIRPIKEASKQDLWKVGKRLRRLEDMRVHFAKWPEGQSSPFPSIQNAFRCYEGTRPSSP